MATNVYQLIKQDGLVIGDHVVGRGPDQRTYVSGDCVESERNLITEHPGKFVQAPPGAKDKYYGKADLSVIPTTPVRGLPSRRTPAPTGPEETGGTRAEIEEVAEAIETGDHDYKHRGDPDKPLKGKTVVKKPVKVAPISKVLAKKDKPVDDDEDLIDVADDDDEDEEKPKKSKKSKKKKKGVKVKAKAQEADNEDD